MRLYLCASLRLPFVVFALTLCRMVGLVAVGIAAIRRMGFTFLQGWFRTPKKWKFRVDAWEKNQYLPARLKRRRSENNIRIHPRKGPSQLTPQGAEGHSR